MNVPTDAGAGDGMFEITTSSFDRAVLAATANDCAGRVGVHWLAHLNREGHTIADRWKAERGFADFRSVDPTTRLTGLELIAIFTRLAAAGEEATRAGLTGWEPDTAKAALMKCLQDMFQADNVRAGRAPDAPGTVTVHLPAEDQLGDGCG